MVLKQYSQIVHDDDKHTGSAKRDTANGVAGLDASKEIINNVPVANIVDMDEQSFTNILKNGDFESWSAGVAAAPDGWPKIAGAVARATSPKMGTYCVELTASASVAAYLNYAITDYSKYASTKVCVGAWVKSSTANQARMRLRDGTAMVYTPYHSGGGDWELLSVVMTVEAIPTQLLIQPRVELDGVSYFDGVILVEGSVCPAFSPKPLVDDGKTLEVESDTNTVKIGGKLVMTCTPQILTGAGAISVESCITHLVTGGVGADAITLADGVEGQEKIVLIKTLTTGGDTSVVTPANFAHGTTFTGNQAGSIQNLIFTNGSWHWTGGRNTVIA